MSHKTVSLMQMTRLAMKQIAYGTYGMHDDKFVSGTGSEQPTMYVALAARIASIIRTQTPQDADNEDSYCRFDEHLPNCFHARLRGLQTIEALPDEDSGRSVRNPPFHKRSTVAVGRLVWAI